MAKRRKRLKPKNSFYLLVAVFVLLILLGIALAALNASFPYVPDSTIVNVKDPVSLDLGEGLVCTDVDSYTGLFMEDGTDEPVSDVMRLVVKNTSEKDLQYAEIRFVYGAEVREFSVSNLASGASCILLEKSRQSMIEGNLDDYMAEHVVFFDEPMKLMEDQFEITGQDGVINVKNISGRDVTKDVVVYYKYAVDDVYYGGITFRVRVSGGMSAGEIRQIPAVHFDKESSVLTMVTCNE